MPVIDPTKAEGSQLMQFVEKQISKINDIVSGKYVCEHCAEVNVNIAIFVLMFYVNCFILCYHGLDGSL
jgi:hypothetical protein